eukprot:scaffold408_cov347-Pavlova_lutheri.AAC.43
MGEQERNFENKLFFVAHLTHIVAHGPVACTSLDWTVHVMLQSYVRVRDLANSIRMPTPGSLPGPDLSCNPCKEFKACVEHSTFSKSTKATGACVLNCMWMSRKPGHRLNTSRSSSSVQFGFKFPTKSVGMGVLPPVAALTTGFGVGFAKMDRFCWA